jgi:hypothetical protein
MNNKTKGHTFWINQANTSKSSINNTATKRKTPDFSSFRDILLQQASISKQIVMHKIILECSLFHETHENNLLVSDSAAFFSTMVNQASILQVNDWVHDSETCRMCQWINEPLYVDCVIIH